MENTKEYQKYGRADGTKMESYFCLEVYINPKSGRMLRIYTYKDSSGNWDEEIYRHDKKEPIYQSQLYRTNYVENRPQFGKYPDFSEMKRIDEKEYIRLMNGLSKKPNVEQ